MRESGLTVELHVTSNLIINGDFSAYLQEMSHSINMKIVKKVTFDQAIVCGDFAS